MCLSRANERQKKKAAERKNRFEFIRFEIATESFVYLALFPPGIATYMFFSFSSEMTKMHAWTKSMNVISIAAIDCDSYQCGWLVTQSLCIFFLSRIFLHDARDRLHQTICSDEVFIWGSYEIILKKWLEILFILKETDYIQCETDRLYFNYFKPHQTLSMLPSDTQRHRTHWNLMQRSQSSEAKVDKKKIIG